jgi:hypothetical protein
MHDQNLPVHNVVIYRSTDELPETSEFSDTGFCIRDLYYGSTATDEEVRLYAAKMVASHFGVTLEEALRRYEIIIIPFVDAYNDDGRILGREVR